MSVNVCIFGVSGYTGSTLLKLLNKHRHVNLIGVFGDKTLGKNKDFISESSKFAKYNSH